MHGRFVANLHGRESDGADDEDADAAQDLIGIHGVLL
jgi:hypothetical protein